MAEDIGHSILKLPRGWKSSFQSGEQGKDGEASCPQRNEAPFSRTLEGDHFAESRNEVNSGVQILLLHSFSSSWYYENLGDCPCCPQGICQRKRESGEPKSVHEAPASATD